MIDGFGKPARTADIIKTLLLHHVLLVRLLRPSARSVLAEQYTRQIKRESLNFGFVASLVLKHSNRPLPVPAACTLNEQLLVVVE